MGRAIERGVLFASDTDRRSFVDCLGIVVSQAGASVYAWSLMPNHFHLLVRTGLTPLSQLMQRLLTGYAVTFNRRHRRSGHVFQNRFQSILVDQDSYLLELVRYIHLNPVRAGLVASVEDLERYPWSGHAAIVAAHPPAWQAVREVLDLFTAPVQAARDRYRTFVSDGLGATAPLGTASDGFVRASDGWHLVRQLRRGREAWAFAERLSGTPSFVDGMFASLPRVTVPPADTDWAAVVARIAVAHGVAPGELTAGGRRLDVVRARAAAAQELVRRHGVSFARAAKLLGVSKWAVARAVSRRR